MSQLPEQVGKRLKEIRRSRGLSQETLAEKADISPRYLSRLEVGQQVASLETLHRLAKALNVQLPELFEFAHHHTPKELRDFLRTFIREADEEQLRLATRLVKAIQL